MMSDAQTDLLFAANRLHHRGFTTPIMYSRSDDILIGKIEGILEEISWRSVDLVAFKREFMMHVDAYLRHREPEIAADRANAVLHLV